MSNHANATNPLPTATSTFSRVTEVALPVIFFAAILLFGILVSLRYAHGWVEVLSEGAAATELRWPSMASLPSLQLWSQLSVPCGST